MEEIQTQQKESFKLIKNTKGYNWEIKILGTGLENGELTNVDLTRLEKLNEEAVKKYGEQAS